MNERIRELAKESGYVYHVGGTVPYFEFSKNQLEKFAELIVRECAGLCHNPVVVLQHFGLDSKSE